MFFKNFWTLPDYLYSSIHMGSGFRLHSSFWKDLSFHLILVHIFLFFSVTERSPGEIPGPRVVGRVPGRRLSELRKRGKRLRSLFLLFLEERNNFVL